MKEVKHDTSKLEFKWPIKVPGIGTGMEYILSD
jgi:hypothetical protein